MKSTWSTVLQCNYIRIYFSSDIDINKMRNDDDDDNDNDNYRTIEVMIKFSKAIFIYGSLHGIALFKWIKNKEEREN